MLDVHVRGRVWRFKSSRPHHLSNNVRSAIKLPEGRQRTLSSPQETRFRAGIGGVEVLTGRSPGRKCRARSCGVRSARGANECARCTRAVPGRPPSPRCWCGRFTRNARESVGISARRVRIGANKRIRAVGFLPSSIFGVGSRRSRSHLRLQDKPRT